MPDAKGDLVICNRAGECGHRGCFHSRRHRRGIVTRDCGGFWCSTVSDRVRCIPVETEGGDDG